LFNEGANPEIYSEETAVFGKEQLCFPYSSQHDIRNGLLMVTAFSRYSKYLEIKRSLKGQELLFLRYLGLKRLFAVKDPRDREKELLIG